MMGMGSFGESGGLMVNAGRMRELGLTDWAKETAKMSSRVGREFKQKSKESVSREDKEHVGRAGLDSGWDKWDCGCHQTRCAMGLAR